MPRKIALLIHSLSGGGAERLMSQLAERWSTTHDVHLVTWSTSETDRYPLPASVKRHSLNLQHPSANPLTAVLANVRRVHRLRDQLKSIGPDFVLSFCDQMNIVALEAARPLSLPVWIAEHSDPSKQRLSRMWEAWRRRSYPTCAGAIALTGPIAQIMQRWIAADKLRVIPPAINPPAINPHTINPPQSEFPHVERESHEVLTFIYLGRLSREKGVDVLLSAWELVAPKLPDARLIVVGDGDQREFLERQARELANVEFRGWVESPWTELAEADIFVLPSRYEGFPVALLEAMASGLACVATDCTTALDELENDRLQTKDAIGDKNLALLRVPVEDPCLMADAMLRLATDVNLCRDLGMAARIVAERYNWTRVGALWDAILSAQ